MQHLQHYGRHMPPHPLDCFWLGSVQLPTAFQQPVASYAWWTLHTLLSCSASVGHSHRLCSCSRLFNQPSSPLEVPRGVPLLRLLYLTLTCLACCWGCVLQDLAAVSVPLNLQNADPKLDTQIKPEQYAAFQKVLTAKAAKGLDTSMVYYKGEGRH